MKATLKSVAQRAGVSVATVSMVLNDKPCRASQATKELIRQAARELHYTPNQTARSLKTQRSYTFGFLVPDISNAFYPDLARCVEEYSSQNGYHLLLGNSNGLYKRDYEYLNLFIERSVDAVIMIPSSTFDDAHADKFYSLVRASGIPVIVIDHHLNPDAVLNLSIDHERGSYLATRHLLSLGHRRIGLCVGLPHLAIAGQRLAGYKRALEEFGCQLDESLVFNDNFDIASGAKAVEYFLGRDITGICCSNDMMALGVYQECARYGLRIPDDLSVIGFDNILLSQILTPALTTVALPIRQIARSSVDLAIRLSREDEEEMEAPGIIQPELVVRNSTKYRHGR